MVQKYYSLFLHWKQGDDLNTFLSNSNSSQEGLLKWAGFMERNAKILRELASLFKQKELDIYANTHHIGLMGDEITLEKAVQKKLIQIDEFEDEEYYENDFQIEEVEPKVEVKRNCIKCHKVLTFPDFYHINSKKFSVVEASFLWKSRNLEFFCCDCIRSFKCSSCSDIFTIELSREGRYIYFCFRCFRSKIRELVSILNLKNDGKSDVFELMFSLKKDLENIFQDINRNIQ